MRSKPQPFVSIVGAGAIGQTVAAAMCSAGSNVRVLTLRAESALRLERDGIIIRRGESSSPPIRLSVSNRPEELAGSSLVMLCVKCQQTSDAIRMLARHIPECTPIILIQNGAGAYDEAAQILPANPIYCGIIRFGAFIDLEGIVSQYGEPSMTLVPRPDASCTSTIESEQLRGIEVEFDTRSRPLIWSKLCLNCGINPTTAIHRICNGQLPGTPDAWQTAVAAATEASRVAGAAGIDLIYEDIEGELRSVCALTAGNHSSMLQDLQKHRATEIEYINGYVIRQAEALGVSVPVNMALREKIQALESAAQ